MLARIGDGYKVHVIHKVTTFVDGPFWVSLCGYESRNPFDLTKVRFDKGFESMAPGLTCFNCRKVLR